MEQKSAVIKVYLVIMKSINDDQKPGELSYSEIADRARLGGSEKPDRKGISRHVFEAVKTILASGIIVADSSPGRITTYSLGITFKGLNRTPTRERSRKPTPSPSGVESGTNLTPKGEKLKTQAIAPQGVRSFTPRGEGPSINSESSEFPTTTTGGDSLSTSPEFTPEDLAEINRRKELIAQRRYGRFVKAYPDTALVMELSRFVPEGFALEACLAAMPQFEKTNSWGRFLTDARKHWHTPERKAAMAEWLQQLEAEEKREADEREVFSAYQQTEPPPTSTPPPSPPPCPDCGGTGVIGHIIDGFEESRFCSCERGDKRRVSEPTLEELSRQTAARLRGLQARASA